MHFAIAEIYQTNHLLYTLGYEIVVRGVIQRYCTIGSEATMCNIANVNLEMKPIEAIFLSDTIVSGPIGNSRYVGPYTLAAQLQQNNIRSVVIDYFTRQENFFEYLSLFCSENLKCVAISSTFLSIFENLGPDADTRNASANNYYNGELWFQDGQELSEWFSRLRATVNKFNPDCKIIIGGAKAQFAIWRSEFYQEVDFICLGNADASIVEFIRCLKENRPVAFKANREVKILDNSYDLNNKLCPHTEWTTTYAVQRQESLPMEIARGCVFNCKFCHYDKKQSFKKDYSHLRDELQKNFDRFGVNAYHFSDDCFNDHPKKVEDICNLIQNLNFKIEWTAYARVDVPVKFPDTMQAMISSGARGLCFGLESFDHKVALNAGKGTPPEKVKEFLNDFKNKYSDECLIEGSFIVGLPGETEKSQVATADWIFESQALDFISIGSLAIMPYVTDFDKIVFDYAEYSRNPEKYGFKNIDFKKRYWEHATFNSLQATQMATKIKENWLKIKGQPSLQTMWLYTHLKTLGYSKSEIFELAKHNRANMTVNAMGRFNHHLENYFSDLVRHNLR